MNKTLLSWDETLFRDIDVFDISYVPEQFDYRDDQTRAISFAIQPGIRGGKMLNTVCRGPPGTGKTTSVKKIFEAVAESSHIIIPVHINCQIDCSEYAVLARIYTSLTKNRAPPTGTSLKQIIDMVARHVEREEIQPLVCLDDANYLIYENQFNKVLYPLLRMHEIFPRVNFGLIIIISDPEIDLTNSLEVRVQSVFHPEIVQFPPYTATEIAGILGARVGWGLYPGIMPPELLDLIVEQTLRFGDTRLGLDLIRRSVLYAEAEARTSVIRADVEKAIAASRDTNLRILYRSLDPDEMLVLSTAISLMTDKRSPTTREVIASLPSDGPKATRVSEIFKKLDSMRFIDLEYSNKGGGRKRFVHPHYDRQTMLNLLKPL